MTVSRCSFLVWKGLAFLALTLFAGGSIAALWLNPRLDLAYHVLNTSLIFAGWFALTWIIAVAAVWYPPRQCRGDCHEL